MFGLKLNDSVASHMSLLHKFHKSIKKIIFLILSSVFLGLIMCWYFLGKHFQWMEDHSMELMWTIIPTMILFSMALPSLFILYQEFPDYYTSFIYKMIGHQWYWSYVNLKKNEEMDSFLIDSKMFRNLEVDKTLMFPYNNAIRLFVTSADVIHSFALPSMAVKVDAVPGRLNECFLFPTKMGKYYGQCSEMCGANHAYMPISVEIISLNVKLVYLSITICGIVGKNFFT